MELPSPEVPKKEFEVKISGETLADPRHPNQDTMKLLPGLIVICDGMGGHPDGDKGQDQALLIAGPEELRKLGKQVDSNDDILYIWHKSQYWLN